MFFMDQSQVERSFLWVPRLPLDFRPRVLRTLHTVEALTPSCLPNAVVVRCGLASMTC